MDIQLTNGKITLDQLGNADTVDGLAAEEQILRNAMLIFKGGWFADANVGVDWVNILDKKFSLATIKAEITRVLQSLSFVTKVLIVSLSDLNPDRSATLTFVVQTIAGNTITFSEVL